MNLHPKHVLKKTLESGMCPRIVIVPPDAQLKRGKIYFLMPLPPPEKSRSKRKRRDSARTTTTTEEDRMQYFHGESSDFRSLSERDSIGENLDAERSAALPRWLVAASFGGHFGDAGSQMLISSKRLITP
ncbi:hypothetical protein SASPL_155895 [Salvia splendens]|uniref:Uncharacterized protein n=1 Tax=Salvia splendens TaxID=180675 RepID=A0A8X8YYK4_SALSN|nr:hypothetical protein SASPL_155895 [Salvia splendens]